MPNKFNGFWENDILNNLSVSIDKFKGELEPLLNAKVKGDSAISSSLAAINKPDVRTTYVASGFDLKSGMDNNYDGNDIGHNGQSKAKTLVRTMQTGPGYAPVSAVRDDSSSYGYSSYQDINSDNGLSMGGGAQTLILIFTAILVVMVVLVSLIVMKYIGL